LPLFSTNGSDAINKNQQIRILCLHSTSGSLGFGVEHKGNEIMDRLL